MRSQENIKGGETHKPTLPITERDPSSYKKNIKQQDPPGPRDTEKNKSQVSHPPNPKKLFGA